MTTPQQLAPLTARDLEHLEAERRTWTHLGAKEAWIRERFECSLTVHYARVTRILTHPDARTWDPQLVDRLTRLQTSRAHHRSARRFQEITTA